MLPLAGSAVQWAMRAVKAVVGICAAATVIAGVVGCGAGRAEPDAQPPKLLPPTEKVVERASNKVEPDTRAISTTYLPKRETVRLTPRRAMLYAPMAGGEWAYSHHPYITSFKGKLYATWSNAPKDEDSRGQRIMLSVAERFDAWSTPRALVTPPASAGGLPVVMTAAGFYEHAGELAAYFGQYDIDHTHTNLGYVTTVDGETWTPPVYMNMPVNANEGPRALQSGRVMMCGNISFLTTSDPAARTGWKMTGLHLPQHPEFEDNPGTFWGVAKNRGWSAALCEGSFIQTADGVVRMMLRSTGAGFRGRLWSTLSSDEGLTWSDPVESEFPDNDHKFQFGRLKDGRYFYLGTPDPQPHTLRSPLILSLSSDGMVFSRHFLVADEPYVMANGGRAKFGEYGYAHAHEHGGELDIIVSRQKEAVEVLRVNISDLAER